MRIADALRGLIVLLAIPVTAAHADIAYLRLSDGYWQVWLTDARGGSHRQLTRDPVDVTRVSWSPDGDQLLCNRNDGGLVRVGVEDGKVVPVLLPLTGMLDADWSPDGEWIAFSLNSAQSTDNNDLWVIRPDGGQRRKLTNLPGVQQNPSWAPDLETLVYTSGSTANGFELWRLDLASGDRIQLTAGPGLKMDPSVGPAGEIAYSSNRHGNYDIWIIDDVDAQPRQLTRHAAYEAQPSWSPDGEQLVFYALRGGERRIWIIERRGGGARPLSPADAASRYPVWGPGDD